MKKLCWIFLLFLLPFFCEASQASGYITMKWIGGYTYQATVVYYSSTASCDPYYYSVDTLRINWGDGQSDLSTRSNGTGDSVCTCRKENIFTATHTFPGPGNYQVWCSTGLRMANILNMIYSSSSNMVLYNTLAILPTGGDSAFPAVNNPPVCTYGCPSQCYYYNPGVSFSGGSISYSLGIPQDAMGYYNPGVSINSITGELSWCNPPLMNGLYNFAIFITTHRQTITGRDTIEVPVDTEEMELEVEIDSKCLAGVGDLKSKNESVSVYPNPSSGVFNLEIRNYELGMNNNVEVYNVLGEKVYSQIIVHTSSFIVNLNNQPDGSYLYRVTNDNGSLVGDGKLVVQSR